MLPFMAMSGEFGHGDSMLPLLATGAISQEQMLPLMMMDGGRFGHRSYGRRHHYGRRPITRGARVATAPVAEASAEASASADN
jgi:hypothetical protein